MLAAPLPDVLYTPPSLQSGGAMASPEWAEELLQLVTPKGTDSVSHTYGKKRSREHIRDEFSHGRDGGDVDAYQPLKRVQRCTDLCRLGELATQVELGLTARRAPEIKAPNPVRATKAVAGDVFDWYFEGEEEDGEDTEASTFF